MDIVHRLHYLVLSQKSDLMTMEREQRMRMRRQSSLPEYSKTNKSRQRLEQAYFNDVSSCERDNNTKIITIDYILEGLTNSLTYIFLYNVIHFKMQV